MADTFTIATMESACTPTSEVKLDMSKFHSVVEEKPAKTFAQYLDHTLLRPDATDEEFDKLTDEAIKYGFASVCVSPYIAGGVIQALSDYPDIKVGSVCAFPLGNLPLRVKLKEAHFLIDAGIQELDFVLHYGEILNDNWDAVKTEMNLMGKLCAQGNVTSKCIVETPVLESDYRLTRVFEILRDYSCIDYIKSSTGMSTRRTEVREIALWNTLRNGNSRPLIKAAGGIKSYERALQMIDAGADRIGTSASVKLMEEYYAAPTAFNERAAQGSQIPVQHSADSSHGTLIL